MIGREKIIKIIEYCLDYDEMSKPCVRCPHGEECDTDIRLLLKDILAYMKEQEPHVLTLEEAKSLKYHTVVWYDYKGQRNLSPRIIDKANDEHVQFIDYYGIWWFNADGYGKLWRLWSAKPTKKQRERTVWDD